MNATHQLVLQFQGDTLSDLDALIAVEDMLTKLLQGYANVDGHDIGSGGSNIFIHTTNPTNTFQRIQPALIRAGIFRSVTVAYRLLDKGKYTVLWPEDSVKPFKII